MKSLPPRPGGRGPSLWMRFGAAQFATAAILASTLLLASVPAAAAEPRPFYAALTAGARVFADRLNLETEAAFGGRVGLGVTDRFSVWLDAANSTPTRMLSRTKVDVTTLRATVQARFRAGPVHPYVTFGVGGQFSNYENAYDTAATIFVVGGGVGWHLAPRTHLFAESTADIYRARTAAYAPTGQLLSASSTETVANTGLLAGVAVEF